MAVNKSAAQIIGFQNSRTQSIYLETEIEDRGYNTVGFCAGARLDWKTKEHTDGTLQHVNCNTGNNGYKWNDQRTLLYMR